MELLLRTAHVSWTIMEGAHIKFFLPEENFRLPLLTKFPVSFMPVQLTTPEELEIFPVFDLTSTDQWVSELFDELSCSALQNHPFFHTELDLSNILSQQLCISAMCAKPWKIVTAEQLALLWDVSLKDAQSNFDCSSQDYIRKIEGKISRKVSTRAHQCQ